MYLLFHDHNPTIEPLNEQPQSQTSWLEILFFKYWSLEKDQEGP